MTAPSISKGRLWVESFWPAAKVRTTATAAKQPIFCEAAHGEKLLTEISGFFT
jgi:hypothetical protein